MLLSFRQFFLACLFVLSGGCSLLIFAFSIEKNKQVKSKRQCAASVVGTKSMTKKRAATPQGQ
jgi:hypothetical protein